MNVDHVLETFNRHRVAYILIGGMNFLLRHAPVLTFDVDFWIEDTPENLDRCEKALGELQAQWGESENDWGPVADRKPGWISSQPVFCLMTPQAPIDIFRRLRGLGPWASCRCRAQQRTTPAGTAYVGLSDEDMLKCQMALPEAEQKQDRIRILKKALEEADHDQHDQ